MEVERYTLATGETAITGFTRLWKPWWFLFIFMAIVPNVWPGFATGAATCLSFVIGDLDIKLVGILGLVAVGITLTASPVVYQTVEGSRPSSSSGSSCGSCSRSSSARRRRVGRRRQRPRELRLDPDGEAVTAAVLAGAIAFAGSGGCGNLAVSNWIRDKGMGMGAYIPRIVSP